MVDSVRIRQAGPADAGAVAQVQGADLARRPTSACCRTRCWSASARPRAPPSGSACSSAVGGGDAVLVAEFDGEIVGFVSSGPIRERIPGYSGEFYALYVLPEAQGCGIGTALIAQAGRAMVRRRWVSAAVWVLEDNDLGRSFYETPGRPAARASPRRSPIAAPATRRCARSPMAGRTCAARPGWSTSGTGGEGLERRTRRSRRLPARRSGAGARPRRPRSGRLPVGARGARPGRARRRRARRRSISARRPPRRHAPPAERELCPVLASVLAAEPAGFARLRATRVAGDRWLGAREPARHRALHDRGRGLAAGALCLRERAVPVRGPGRRARALRGARPRTSIGA